MCACYREIADAALKGEDIDFEEARLPEPIENGGRLHFKLGEMGHLRCALCKRPLVLDDWSEEKVCACWEAVEKPRGYPERYPWPLPEGRGYKVEEAFVTMQWRAVEKPPVEIAHETETPAVVLPGGEAK